MVSVQVPGLQGAGLPEGAVGCAIAALDATRLPVNAIAPANKRLSMLFSSVGLRYRSF